MTDRYDHESGNGWKPTSRESSEPSRTVPAPQTGVEPKSPAMTGKADSPTAKGDAPVTAKDLDAIRQQLGALSDALLTTRDVKRIVEEAVVPLATKTGQKHLAKKSDWKSFATKEDLRRRTGTIRNEVKSSLKKCASKADLKRLPSKENLGTALKSIKTEIGENKKGLARLEKQLQSLTALLKAGASQRQP